MKWTVITGACGGLGQAFAKQCAQNNENIVIVGTDETRCIDLVNQLKKSTSSEIQYLICDLSKESEVKKCLKKLQEKEVNLLINNAGFGCYGAFDQMEIRELVQMNQVNMNALMMLCHAVIPSMKKTGGSILNVASTASFQPGPYMANYYASKAYVLSFSEALSVELEEYGISVCALCCGPMETGFTQRAHLKHTWMQKMMMISTEQAVKKGLKGLRKGKRRVIPGVMNRIMIWFSHVIPHSLLLKVMSYSQSKRKEL